MAARKVIVNGETLKLIGRGAFSRVYSIPSNDKEVFIKSCDPVKELMANGWFPDSERFPRTRHAVNLEGEEGYIQERFEKVSSLKKSLIPSEYKLYKELETLFKGYSDTDNYHRAIRSDNSMYFLIKELKNSNLSSEVKEILISALEECGNFGTDVCLEVSPRNVAVRDGKLVFLDLFFLQKYLTKVRRGDIRPM